jgi:broad specificity phosphatase PhoE
MYLGISVFSFQMSITVIRHGETLYNVDLAYLETPDVPLTPFGYLQASRLEGIYTHVFVSPLSRARMTLESSDIDAEIVVIEPLIREYAQYQCDFLDYEKVIPEVPSELSDRCQQFITKLVTQYPGENICVITHAYWLTEFLRQCRFPVEHYPNNCETFRIPYPDVVAT